MIKNSYLFSQVHQPFFLASFFWAILSMTIFTMAYKGLVTLTQNPLEFHYYTLSFGVVFQAFIGFIFTTFPKFCQSDIVPKKLYIPLFMLFQLGVFIYLIGSILSLKSLIHIALLLNLVTFTVVIVTIFRIYKQTNMQTKHDPFWIFSGFFAGFIAHTVIVLKELLTYFSINSIVTTLLNSLAMNITVYLFLTFVTFSVAQRMVHFFSHSIVQKKKNFVLYVFLQLLAITLLQTVVQITEYALLATAFIKVFLATYLFLEFRRWELPFKSSAVILQILHVALFWFPAAMFLNGLSDIHFYISATSNAALGIHLLLLGFIITMLIGFGTRVTLGHSGQPPHADIITTQIFYLTQIVVFFRFAYSLNIGFSMELDFLFDIAATLWILMFVFWIARFAKVLIFAKKLNL